MTDDELADWLKRHWDEAQDDSGQADPEVDSLRFFTPFFVLLDEAWRTKLLTEIGVELDSRGAPLEAREDWRDLLEGA